MSEHGEPPAIVRRALEGRTLQELFLDLLAAQGAELQGVDSYVESHKVPGFLTLVELTEQSAAAADAIVVLTDHDYLDYPIVENAPGYVLDTRRRLVGTREPLLGRPRRQAAP
mgnify:CR=1 FL=1